MAKKPKPAPQQRTWDGLLEDDVTGADEAEDAMPIEFGRKPSRPRDAKKNSDTDSKQ